MEEKRIKLYQKLKESNSYTKSYNEFIEQFFNNSTNCDKLYNSCVSDGSFSKTKKEWYEKFACDLEWAGTTTYCGGGSTPPPGPPPVSSCPTTTATGADIISGTFIKKCVQGDIVKEIQKHLKKHGFPNFSKDGSIDSVFGGRTKKMVIDFQNEKKLTPDGVVGPKTWVELVKDKSSKPTAPPKPVTPINPGPESSGKDNIQLDDL